MHIEDAEDEESDEYKDERENQDPSKCRRKKNYKWKDKTDKDREINQKF